MTGLATVVAAGVVAVWLGWMLRVPSILLLLLFGFLAGPILGFIAPDALFGDVLFPLVSLAVAVVLFEGGLSLRFSDVRGHGRVVTLLVSAGVSITWLIASIASHWFLGFDWAISFLMGAVVLVSGPTVVGPLLRHIRPARRVASVLNWESIVIDPIGVVIAVLVFQGVVTGSVAGATLGAAADLLTTIAVGAFGGGLTAALLVLLMRRYWVPDYLHAPVTLAAVVTAYAVSNVVESESGLLTVVVMGIALANQKFAEVSHIRGFKEDLRVVLIGALFIVLAARMELDDLRQVWVPAIGLVAVLVLVARPLAVAVSTARSGLSWRERVFVGWLAPRGIVAAAASAIFSFELAHAGVAGGDRLLAATFMVIVGTVIVYGLTAPLVARVLGLAAPREGGVLILGAHRLARQIAAPLSSNGRRVVLVDLNSVNVSMARRAGFEAVHANILSDYALDEVELHGMTAFLALTSNDEANTLAVQHFVEAFGSDRVYQLRPSPGGGDSSRHGIAPRHRGRLLFSPDLDGRGVQEMLEQGAGIETVVVPEDGSVRAGGRKCWPLFVLSKEGTVRIVIGDDPPPARAGDRMVMLTAPLGT
ncbi:MAG: sodium:proton antiporter [Chloroflexi bacterium]|nr:sodium:proton antiporter [Chloroflexota bacterium]